MAHAAGVVSRFSDVNDGEAITPRSINPWIEGRSRGEQPGRPHRPRRTRTEVPDEPGNGAEGYD
jgi:hypothetical protein